MSTVSTFLSSLSPSFSRLNLVRSSSAISPHIPHVARTASAPRPASHSPSAAAAEQRWRHMGTQHGSLSRSLHKPTPLSAQARSFCLHPLPCEQPRPHSESHNGKNDLLSRTAGRIRTNLLRLPGVESQRRASRCRMLEERDGAPHHHASPPPSPPLSLRPAKSTQPAVREDKHATDPHSSPDPNGALRAAGPGRRRRWRVEAQQRRRGSRAPDRAFVALKSTGSRRRVGTHSCPPSRSAGRSYPPRPHQGGAPQRRRRLRVDASARICRSRLLTTRPSSRMNRRSLYGK